MNVLQNTKTREKLAKILGFSLTYQVQARKIRWKFIIIVNDSQQIPVAGRRLEGTFKFGGEPSKWLCRFGRMVSEGTLDLLPYFRTDLTVRSHFPYILHEKKAFLEAGWVKVLCSFHMLTPGRTTSLQDLLRAPAAFVPRIFGRHGSCFMVVPFSNVGLWSFKLRFPKYRRDRLLVIEDFEMAYQCRCL